MIPTTLCETLLYKFTEQNFIGTSLFAHFKNSNNKPIPTPQCNLYCQKKPSCSSCQGGCFCLQAHEKIASHLEAEPATGHARSNFEEIRHNAFVKSSQAFLRNYHSYCIEDSFVLISHSRHGINLETSAKYITTESAIQHSPN